jgi:uncharacterized protein (TIGR03118 family)
MNGFGSQKLDPVSRLSAATMLSSISSRKVIDALLHSRFAADLVESLGSFTRVTLAGNFVDPKLPKGFVPYNIANIGGELFVTYRGSNFHGGAVAEFNTDGTFVRQIASNKARGKLQSPWGVALAPAGFGKFSNDLLVGNFSSGRIDAYSTKGRFRAQLASTTGKPITIPGLWTLGFGNGLKAGPTTDLLFTAGIDGEIHGLFGTFQFVTRARSS